MTLEGSIVGALVTKGGTKEVCAQISGWRDKKLPREVMEYRLQQAGGHEYQSTSCHSTAYPDLETERGV